MSIKTGSTGEEYAANLLASNGYKVVDRNFSCKFGEIDIIAIKDNILVFVEVKTRTSVKFGLPQEAVTPYKLRKIAKVGDYFCLLKKGLPLKKRIDVVSLIIENGIITNSQIIPVV